MTEIRKIEVQTYDPSWKQLFAEESDRIREALDDNFLAIHHVGSTSVPGLAAKPKIDILAVVKEPKKAILQLTPLNYVYKGEFNIPFHFGLSKRIGVNVNLHIYEEGHAEIELNLAFRDYLRQNAAVKAEYAILKEQLLQLPTSFEKNNSMFTGYNLGKDAFIRKVLEKIGFNALRFLHCTHYLEWEAAKTLRQKFFFDHVPIEDPYTWTFNHPEHKHFVLCKGTSVIGYAHVQLWPNSRAAMRIIVIDTPNRGFGYGRQFVEWIELWLKQVDIKSLHTEASPNAVGFYTALGFINRPFNDPDGYPSDPQDTALVKFL